MGSMTEEELRGIVGREISEARGYDADELSSDRRNALRYYFGRPRGDEVEGRSTVQSLDVTDQVNSIMAQLAPMMKSTLVEFVPGAEQEEDQAQLESDFCMYIAEQSNAYEQFSSAAFDSLLQANGWIKTYVTDDIQRWTTRHTDLTDATVIDALQPTDPNETVEIKSQSTSDETGLHTIAVEHTIQEKRLKIAAIAPEYMLFAAGHLTQDLTDLRFLAEKKLITRSALKDEGYPQAKIDQLGQVDYETWEGATERAYSYDDKRSGEERTTEVVDIYECYLHVDFDGDGIAELRRIIVGGYEAAVILDNEEAKFIPYCTGSALPLPHRLTGTSMYQLLKPVQDAKTAILRNWLDNHATANNSRFGAVEGEVNMQDVVSARASQVIRMRSPDALFPIPFNDVGPSAISALNYLDQIRTERGGAALDMMAGEMQVAASSATAAANEYGHKEKMSAFYCRNIVESLIRGTFLLIHQSLRENYDSEITAKLHGKWQKTNPGQWPRRRNMRVLAGMSSSERRQKAAALSQNLGYQVQAMSSGMEGELVTADKIHSTLADWLRASDLQDVESYYVDPSSEEAQAARDGKAKQAEGQKAEMDKLAQRLVDNEQALDKWKHQTELDYKRWSDTLDAAVEEMKVVGKAAGDAELENLKQEGAPDATQNS